MNMTRSKYAYLLAEYPETISKEQLCKIIHVRKYTALYYLESKLLPCVDTGKATHRYSIRMSDVVTMLEDRDATNKQFIEFASRNGEVYYIVIDYAKDTFA